MGVLWTVWPLDQDMQTWLDGIEIAYPAKASRFPTGLEIKTTLVAMDDFAVENTDNGIGGMWQAFIVHLHGGDEHPWTLLNISEYSGDDKPQEL